MFRATIGGKSIHFDEVNPDVFADAARATKGLGWYEVYQGPAADLPSARALIAKLAAILEVDPPSTETVRDLMSVFKLEILDDTPDAYEDGRPLAEAEPTTAG